VEVDAAIQDERAVNLISTQPVTPSVCVESRRVLTRGRALGTRAAVQRSMSMVASGRIAPLHVFDYLFAVRQRVMVCEAAELAPAELAACKILAIANATCSCLSILQFATGPKRSMGHVLGAEKGKILIRGRRRPTVYGGRTS